MTKKVCESVSKYFITCMNEVDYQIAKGDRICSVCGDTFNTRNCKNCPMINIKYELYKSKSGLLDIINKYISDYFMMCVD